MKRIIGIFLIMMLTVGLFGGCGKNEEVTGTTIQKNEEKTIVMKLANATAPGDPREAAAMKFAELVNEKTNGKVKVEVYSGGTLGDWRDTIEGLKPGIVQVVVESLGTIEPYTNLAAVDAVPFLYKDDKHFQKVWDGDFGGELLKTIGNLGDFELMGPMYRGARYVTSKKPIYTADDIKGLKIRVPNIKIYMKTWETLGAAATPMAFTEVYTGLQQGTVDAQENPLTLSYSSAFYEVCPYLIETKHVYSTDLFIFDKGYFASLPEDVQTAIKESASIASNERTETEKANEASLIAKFEAKGVTFIKPDMASIKAKFEGFIDEFPEIKDLVERIEAME